MVKQMQMSDETFLAVVRKTRKGCWRYCPIPNSNTLGKTLILEDSLCLPTNPMLPTDCTIYNSNPVAFILIVKFFNSNQAEQ